MGIEGQHHGRAAGRPRVAHRQRDEGLMAAVHAVEVPHRHRGLRPAARLGGVEAHHLHRGGYGFSGGRTLSITGGMVRPVSSTPLSR